MEAGEGEMSVQLQRPVGSDGTQVQLTSTPELQPSVHTDVTEIGWTFRSETQ